jgi:hypothetical protein
MWNHYKGILAQNNSFELLRISMACIFPPYIDLDIWKNHFPFVWIIIHGLFSVQKDFWRFRNIDLDLVQGIILIPKNFIKLNFAKDSFLEDLWNSYLKLSSNNLFELR